MTYFEKKQQTYIKMQKTEFRLSMFDCLELNDINGMPLLVGFNKKFRQNHSLEFLKNKFRGK